MTLPSVPWLLVRSSRTNQARDPAVVAVDRTNCGSHFCPVMGMASSLLLGTTQTKGKNTFISYFAQCAGYELAPTMLFMAQKGYLAAGGTLLLGAYSTIGS